MRAHPAVLRLFCGSAKVASAICFGAVPLPHPWWVEARLCVVPFHKTLIKTGGRAPSTGLPLPTGDDGGTKMIQCETVCSYCQSTYTVLQEKLWRGMLSQNVLNLNNCNKGGSLEAAHQGPLEQKITWWRQGEEWTEFNCFFITYVWVIFDLHTRDPPSPPPPKKLRVAEASH